MKLLDALFKCNVGKLIKFMHKSEIEAFQWNADDEGEENLR